MEYEDVKKLREEWADYVNRRNPFSFGEEEIDLDDFKELAKRTFEVIKQAKETYLYRNCLPEDITLTLQYLELLSVFSQYTYYDNMEDESDNRIFTATCLVAEGLRDFAVFLDDIKLEENKRVYFIDDETASGNLFFYRDDYPFIEGRISDEELKKVYKYNIYEGDLTKLIELANSMI